MAVAQQALPLDGVRYEALMSEDSRYFQDQQAQTEHIGRITSMPDSLSILAIAYEDIQSLDEGCLHI